MNSSNRASRFGQFEADPAREQRDDELVEGDALLGCEGDELLVERGGAPDQDSAIRVHTADNIISAIDIASSACDITPMPTPKTYTEIYVTVTKTGTKRYSYFSTRQMRLFPVKRDVAELSIAAGATVYRKQAGTSIWAEGGVEVIG